MRKQRCIWTAIGVFFLYCMIEKLWLMRLDGWSIYFYYIRPAVFLLLTFGIFQLRRTKKKVSLKLLPNAVLFAVFSGILYVATYLAFGILDGFGKNPFDTSIKGIGVNLFSFIPYYLFLELFRDQVVNKSSKEKQSVVIILIIALYTMMEVNWNSLLALKPTDIEGLVKFIGTVLLPSLLKNGYLCTVVALSGPGSSLFIQICYRCLFYIFPVLPNLKWITEALLNTLFPLFSWMSFKNAVLVREGRERRSRGKEESVWSWIATSLVSISIVWFAVGIFPIFPTVILTGSMEPVFYPGDVAILEKTDPTSLKEGDIIQYWAESFFILHRVTQLLPNGQYITKGDNNNCADVKAVDPGQIKGRIIYRVPYLGKPVVLIRSMKGESVDVVGDKFELGGNHK